MKMICILFPFLFPHTFSADVGFMLEALTAQGGICGDWGNVMRYLSEGALKDKDCVVKGV